MEPGFDGRSSSLHEPGAGHAADLVHRADAGQAEAQAVLAQGGHALADGRSEDVLGRLLDEAAHLTGDRHDLAQRDAAGVARPTAPRTADGAVEGGGARAA